jgi:hypothetical protein
MSKRSRGRPPIAELRVTPAQRLELRRVAGENGTGVAGMLREAVNEYVADYHERRIFNRQKR